MFHRILVPIDISDQAQAEKIIRIARNMATEPGAELHVLTVAPTFNMSIVGSHFPKDFEKSTLEKTKKVLQNILDTQSSGDILIKGHVAHGTVYDEIMKAANTMGCDLIVVGSHRPELKDYLLGPNAARVVRHAKQSVFVVRDPLTDGS